MTWVKGKHTVTIGTHNELFKFYNLFIQNLYGNYEFSSVANLQAGLAQAYSHFFSNMDIFNLLNLLNKDWGWSTTPTSTARRRSAIAA